MKIGNAILQLVRRTVRRFVRLLKWLLKLRAVVVQYHALEKAVDADNGAEEALARGDLVEYGRLKELAEVRWAVWHTIRESNPSRQPPPVGGRLDGVVGPLN